MNRIRFLPPIVFLIFATVLAFSFAAAQTARKPTADHQTIQQPEPSTQTSPTKTDIRISPMRPKGSIASTATDHCVNDLYVDIKNTYNSLSKLCTFVPAPSFQAYSSLRGRLNLLNLDWRRSNCQTQAILEVIKNEVGAIYSSRIAEATSKCMKSCLNVVDGQVSAGNFDASLSQCRSCCDFLPEASKTECQVHCSQGISREQVAARLRDEAKNSADSAKEFWKEALRLLQEMAEREAENIRTLTNP